MKKCLLFLCYLLCTLAFVLVSCGEGVQGNQSQHVTLRYAIWDQNQAPAMKQIATEFEKAHPNITVNVEVTPYTDYFVKLETATTGGSAPDVFWMNAATFPKYASNDTVLALDDRIQKDGIDLKNYPASLVSLYTYNSKHYGLPKDFDTIGLWYNKTLFDAAGVKYPDDTWTWDSLLQAAKKLTNPSKGIWGIAAPTTDNEGYYNIIPQNGGTIISADKKTSGFDSAASIGALQFIQSMIDEHVSPTQAQMTDTQPLSMFESGKVAMFYGGAWRAVEFGKNEYTKDKVDVAVLPKGKVRASRIHGLANLIAAGSKNPDAAWEFVKFLGSKQAADIQANTGTVIPAYNGTQNGWLKAYPTFHLQAFIDELAYAVPYPVSKNSDAWVELQDKTLADVWSGKTSVQGGAKQLAQQMNQALAQEKQE